MISALEGVGIVCIAVVGLQLCRHVYQILYGYVIGPLLQKNVNFSEFGKWAVITGATDGIGKAFAEHLAKKGMDVVLISRTMSKLQTVAEDLQATYKVRTKVIEADFSDPSPEVYSKIEKDLKSLKPPPIVLVNNVGMCYPYPEYFSDVSDKDSLFTKIVICNTLSVTNMTKILLPFMQQEKKGVIINISSMSAIVPFPLTSVYSATKSFVLKFSKDLATEYEKSGIVIQCLVTGYVATKMSAITRPGLMAPSPDVYVEKALSTTGIQRVTTGYFPHSLLAVGVQLCESVCPSLTAWVVLKRAEYIRNEALKRRAAM